MGHAEVQTPCWSQDTGKHLPRDHLKEDPVSLRALAEKKLSARSPDGSRVRRESHARFCERPEGRFLRPTHHRYHYIRDGSFAEDASRIRCNPGIFARLRSFAANILRFNGVHNVTDGRHRIAFGGIRAILAMRVIY